MRHLSGLLDSPPGQVANWFPHAPLPGGTSAWIDAAMLAAHRMPRTEKAPQPPGVSVTGYWPATWET